MTLKWTSKDPACNMCVNRNDDYGDVSDSGRGSVAAATIPIMQVKKIIAGNSWKMRKLEVFGCNPVIANMHFLDMAKF
jgi:hypothetical protein